MIAQRGAAVERIIAALRQTGSKVEQSGTRYKVGRPPSLDAVTGEHRAGCVHRVPVMPVQPCRLPESGPPRE